MIAWLLLILSFVAIAMMFWRRFQLTRKDMVFQEDLAAEEAAPEPEVEAAPAPEPEPETLDVRKHYARADVLFGRKKWDEAEPMFLAILEVEPKHLDSHHKLGLLHMKQGNFGEAEIYFSKLLSLKKDPVYFSNLGAALYQQQRLVEAAEAYENAVAMDDKRSARFVSLGQVYHELGDFEKALSHFERASEKKKKDVNLLMILADYYLRFERKEEATDVLKRVLDMDPYNEEATNLLNEI